MTLDGPLMLCSTTMRAGVATASLLLIATVVAAQTSTSVALPETLAFVAHIIDTDLTGGYQAVVTDLNGDDLPDVIALSTRLPDLVWYENPDWRKHVIATGLHRMINLAAHDIDGDGIAELALSHGFATSYGESEGTVSLLTHASDPRQLWAIREIDRVPTTHRLRWADIDGSGSKVLVSAPLVGPGSTAPDYHDTLSLLWYRPGDWRRQVMTAAERGVVHGIAVAPWSAAGHDAVLSASFLGVHVHEFTEGRWTRTRVAEGDPGSWPESGASEVQVGYTAGERFVATIEPWHGHQVVVYRSSGSGSPAWTRQPIDATIEDGHTLVVADLDGDGHDEIIAGERRGQQSVYLYRFDSSSASWFKETVDDGDMAAAGCAVSDLDADGLPDVVCIGTGTANLKWYENVGN